MKNLLAGLGCLVMGIGLFIAGFYFATSSDVTCGGQVMGQGEHCQHMTRGQSDNDYGQEKAKTHRVGIAMMVFGGLMALGSGSFFFEEVKRRRRRSIPEGVAAAPESLRTGLPQANAPPSASPEMPASPASASAPAGVGGVADGDFRRPVELGCVIDADAVMRRGAALLVILGIVVWVAVALVVGLMVPEPGWVSAVAATVVAAPCVALAYVSKRNQLRRTYGQRQRLVVHPGGLRRFDANLVIDIAWAGIDRFERRNSSLPPGGEVSGYVPGSVPVNVAAARTHTVMACGIVGAGTIAPLPNASRRMLKFQDRLYGSDLAGGYPHTSENCLIFPAEFEHDWATGVVGAWLRHFRPDLVVPRDR